MCYFNLYFCGAVKYLREVTPYFRKSSLLSEIGWGATSESTVDPLSSTSGPTSSGETKILPLYLCFICRNVSFPDASNSTIEIHASNARSVVCLRAVDERSAARWYSALVSATESASRTAVAEANSLLADDTFTATGGTREVRHIGWLAEQV